MPDNRSGKFTKSRRFLGRYDHYVNRDNLACNRTSYLHLYFKFFVKRYRVTDNDKNVPVALCIAISTRARAKKNALLHIGNPRHGGF